MGAGRLDDPTLSNWRDLADRPWRGLLVGNGASRAVWEEFKYDSLYEVARTVIAPPLSIADKWLFRRLGNTTNFETVLGALLTSRTVCTAVGLPVETINERYESIRNALVRAVHRVHVPWNLVTQDRLIAIRNALLEYRYVFSTNYDLLLYWAVMAEQPTEFRDFFWGGHFDASDAEIRDEHTTRVLYLHGALHLYYDINTGRTHKASAEQFANLLALFGQTPDAVPLCVTEGTAEHKLGAIARSDYLSFALHEFSRFRGGLVIFGHSLGDTDRHLIAVLDRYRDRAIACAILPLDERHIVREKARIRALLPDANLLYFDATTHPLGGPGVRVLPP